MPNRHSLEDLPFVTRRQDGRIDFWDPPLGLAWAAANAKGREFALLLIQKQEAHDLAIETVLRAITIKGYVGGVEVSLFRTLAEHVSRAASPE